MSLFVLREKTPPDELVKELGEVFPIEVRKEPKERVTYHDTFDWSLDRAGLTLATTRIGRQVRVALTTTDGRVLDSIAQNTPEFASDLAPAPLPGIVEPVAKHRRLLPRARGEWTGIFISIVNPDGKAVGRLRIRIGTATPSNGEGEIDLAPRIEFFALKGYNAEEKRVTAFLKERFRVKRVKRSEQAAIYDAVGLSPGDYTSSLRLKLDPEAPAAGAAKQIHLGLLRIIEANREGLTRDWDAEFLHDFRTAVRRTRSALSQIRDVFPPDVADHFMKEFRWLGSKTGPARDIDVYLLKIPAYRAALYPSARKDLEPLVRLLKEKKKAELSRLRRCIHSRRFKKLLGDWRVFLEDSEGAEAVGSETGGSETEAPAPLRANTPIKEVASSRIWAAFRKVQKKGSRIGQFSPAEDLHKLRLDCKKLRYLLRFFQSLYPADALDPVIREIKNLQDHLGDYNDLQVQRDALRGFAEEIMESKAAPPATLLAMGQLMGQLEGKQHKERDLFHDHFSRFSRERNVRRFRRLFGPEPDTDAQTPSKRKKR